MTQAGVSERRLGSVGELTSERLAELRRVAEAATPGPWRISDDGPADRFVIASADREHIAETTQGGSFTNEDLANAHHISTFDPTTVLALLDEIERLRRERQTLVEAVRLREEARKASAAIPRARPGKARSAVEAAWAAKDAAEDAHAAALALLGGEKGDGIRGA